jgi:hypothetical protein
MGFPQGGGGKGFQGWSGLLFFFRRRACFFSSKKEGFSKPFSFFAMQKKSLEMTILPITAVAAAG